MKRGVFARGVDGKRGVIQPSGVLIANYIKNGADYYFSERICS